MYVVADAVSAGAPGWLNLVVLVLMVSGLGLSLWHRANVRNPDFPEAT